MAKKGMPELNTSSTADISFMLLIFFLITTSMATDRGLARQLPPPPDPNQKQDDDQNKVKERNVLKIRMNSQD
jgi:biopolymer transport protein ExbD